MHRTALDPQPGCARGITCWGVCLVLAACSGSSRDLDRDPPSGRDSGQDQGRGSSSDSGARDSGSPDAGASSTGEPTDVRFSFFVTSYRAMQKLSGSEAGFGGDLRYGEADGLAGADKICREIAESSL